MSENYLIDNRLQKIYNNCCKNGGKVNARISKSVSYNAII